MIKSSGWDTYCIWEHSQTVKDLYRKRARQEAEEMTSHAQAAKLLKPLIRAGETVLDVGCGSGYFFHSLKKQGITAEYHGIDGARSLIEIGQAEMPAQGLPADRLHHLRIEDLDGQVDHVVCLNVLSNIDNYHRPLERMLKMARKSVILRESLDDKHAGYSYVHDKYLDADVHLNVHVNTYALSQCVKFVATYGFSAKVIDDEYTQGEPQQVIDHPHYWRFLLATRGNP